MYLAGCRLERGSFTPKFFEVTPFPPPPRCCSYLADFVNRCWFRVRLPPTHGELFIKIRVPIISFLGPHTVIDFTHTHTPAGRELLMSGDPGRIRNIFRKKEKTRVSRSRPRINQRTRWHFFAGLIYTEPKIIDRTTFSQT